MVNLFDEITGTIVDSDCCAVGQIAEFHWLRPPAQAIWIWYKDYLVQVQFGGGDGFLRNSDLHDLGEFTLSTGGIRRSDCVEIQQTRIDIAINISRNTGWNRCNLRPWTTAGVVTIDKVSTDILCRFCPIEDNLVSVACRC